MGMSNARKLASVTVEDFAGFPKDSQILYLYNLFWRCELFDSIPLTNNQLTKLYVA